MRTAWVLLALLSSTAAAQADVPEGPLPERVTPSAYRLDLHVDPGQPRFSAHAEIDAVLAQPSSVIYLHGNGLRVKSARVRAGAKTYSAHYAQVDPLGVARLDLPRPAPAGPITLYFDYSGELRHTADGLYHAKVGKDWYAWTQMEAIDARRVFPGFDEPRFKTPFSLTIRAPKGA